MKVNIKEKKVDRVETKTLKEMQPLDVFEGHQGEGIYLVLSLDHEKHLIYTKNLKVNTLMKFNYNHNYNYKLLKSTLTIQK